MKIYKHENVYGMANLVPKKTGLSCDLWSEHKGASRKLSHCNTPRIKISLDGQSVSVTIEPNPKTLTSLDKFKQSGIKKIKEAIEYVGRNSDIFLKHFSDKDDSFDDEDLFNALRQRNEYK